MPTNKSLTVEITDQNGVPLKEWGKQVLKKTPNNTSTSCYIEATTGMTFRIFIAPDMPFPPIAERNISLDSWRSRHGFGANKPSRIPFHLVASVCIDGCEKPDKRTIVYLDQEHKWYKDHYDLSGPTKLDDDGNCRSHNWVFNELGIHTLLDELSLDFTGEPGSKEPEPEQPEDPLAGLLRDLDTKLEEKEPTSNAGVIEVTFERVTLSETTHYDEWKPESLGGGSSKGTKMAKNISHAAGVTAGKKINKMVNYIDYYLIDKPGVTFATFKFFYRSQDVLRKFDFPGFPPKAVEPVEKEKATEENTATPDHNLFGDLNINGNGNGTGHKRNSRNEDENCGDESPTRNKSAKKAANQNIHGFADKHTHHYASDDDSDDEETTEQTLELDYMRRAPTVFKTSMDDKTEKESDSDKENRETKPGEEDQEL